MSANSNIFSFFCRRYRALALIWACLCVGMAATAQKTDQTDQTTTYTYQKTLGKSGRPLVTNTLGGYTMQAAHEAWNVVYSKLILNSSSSETKKHSSPMHVGMITKPMKKYRISR